MMADNDTRLGVVVDLWDTRPPNNKPRPDHSRPAKHTGHVSDEWMGAILAETARRCLAEAARSTGP